LAMGATGGILASANIAPQHCIEIYNAFRKGEADRAKHLQQTIIQPNAAVTSRWGVPALKAAMDHLGLWGGHVRRPLLPLREELRQQLLTLLGDSEILFFNESED